MAVCPVPTKRLRITAPGLITLVGLLLGGATAPYAQTGAEPPPCEGCTPPPPCVANARGEPECPRGTAAIQPHEEYHKRVRSAELVTPMASEVFGDSVSLFNGATEFSVVDIDVPGNNALPVQLRRTFKVESRKGAALGYFGAWDLDVPYLSGVFNSAHLWDQGQGGVTDRCDANFRPQHGVNILDNEIWTGTYLHLPGQGDRELLWHEPSQQHPVPTDGPSYKWITRDNIRLTCLPSVTNISSPPSPGAPHPYNGKGFLAIDGNGVKYYFNVAAHRSQSAVTRPPYVYNRTRVYLLVSKIEDRHGNVVQYHWADGKLNSITSNDGRSITITNTWDSADGGYYRITSANAHGRAWNYAYHASQALGAPARKVLTTVTLNDGSFWNYTYTGTLYPVYETGTPPAGSCDPLFTNGNGEDFTLGVTHPAGAVGSFVFKYTRHHRNGIHANTCLPPTYQSTMPATSDLYSLMSKTITGPGIAAQTWAYNYGIVAYPRDNYAGTWCQTCTPSKTVTVTRPDNTKEEQRFGVVWNYNDGRLLGTRTLSATSTQLRDLTNTYVSETEIGSMPFPSKIGSNSASDDPAAVNLRPVKQTTIVQQGVSFGNTVNSFDSFARPTSVTKANGLSFSKTELTTYYDHLAKWVVGQISSVQDQGTGKYPVGRIFDGTTALPLQEYAFGKLTERRTYHTTGTQAGLPYEIYDGSNVKKTALSNYHRGIPRSVVYHDGNSESASVTDWAEISAITDPMGYTTSYGYDAMGRLALILYPSADSVAWEQTVLSFERINAVEHGLPAGHWRQVVRTGKNRKITYFDGLWRPVLSSHYDMDNEAGTRRMIQRRFDYANRETLVSYPSQWIAAYDSAVMSATTSYDALGRPVTKQANSELGILTTNFSYISLFRTQVTDPRGYTVTTRFQAFDQPTTDAPVQIEYPGSIVTDIARDVFGKATSITRSGPYGGGTVSAVRRFVYDTNERLCKTYDPEADWTVMDYDASNNVLWTASGLTTVTSLTDCQRTSIAAADKSTRSYDGRNRLTFIDHPTGTPDVGYSYYNDGALWTTTNDGSTWTYTYNKRRLLTGETLAVNSLSLPLTHTYDAHGNRSQLTYPDGTVVAFAPNALGEPTQAGTYATGATYHPNGVLAGFTYGNGIVHSQSLNTRQLPLLRRDYYGSTHYTHYTYGYDNNANVTGITDGTSGAKENRTLVYDALNRMTQANAPNNFGTEVYTYDPLDNIRTVIIGGNLNLTYSYASKNRLTQLQLVDPSGSLTHSYLYDPRGNMTTRTSGHTHSYDRANRMLTATTPAGTETYRYDGHGRRTSIVRAGGTTTQVYSRDGTFLYERGPSGTVTKHVYLGNRLVATHSLGTTFYAHTNALGSVVRKTNASRVETARTIYEPYGSMGSIGSYTQGPGFTGHVTDQATTLSYMQARYYDSTAMRFVSVDPVGPSTSDGSNFNRHWYANANPYKFVDPDGSESTHMLNYLRNNPNDASKNFSDNLQAAVDFIPVVGDIKGIADAFADPSFANIAAAVVGLAGPLGDAAGKGIKAADTVATANRAESRAKGVPDSQIGPSGKPKNHTVDHGGKRGEAREAARRDAGKSGGTVNHTSPKEGKDHYHGVSRDGEKSRVHHEYNR